MDMCRTSAGAGETDPWNETPFRRPQIPAV